MDWIATLEIIRAYRPCDGPQPVHLRRNVPFLAHSLLQDRLISTSANVMMTP